MLTFLTRRERFNAAHRMYRQDLTEEENLKMFGKCANPNYHGHNYDLFVTVKGEVNPERPYIIDLKELKVIINDLVIEKLDHKNLNLDVDFMADKMASTELLCVEIFKLLQGPLEAYEGVFLHSVRLAETENNSAECFG
ncbi:6-carboxytetrahydropterin synthase [uncultured Chitinophaga sp.]|uniref:6-pyruvoyl trahydropterin synthase family protein n=1 Tax=uncultured Chitinophaga sp. TaxID=339340 RepID=UPI0025CFFCF2|nr:6-carboxytetrahydropterin synthase [uncultured Chitinophaga sp.]